MKEIKTMLAITYIKNILQSEYNRHINEIIRHKIRGRSGSNRQKRKLTKHLDKLWEVKKIAKLLGIKLDLRKELKELDFLKTICNPNNSDYRAIKERIGELEKK